MKRFILLIAAMALMMSPFVAQALEVSIDKEISKSTEVSNKKDLSVTIDASITIAKDDLTVDGLASAEIDNNQLLRQNEVTNEENTNTATISGDALKDAKGNIAVNVVAGDNNAQDNLTAITASDQAKSMTDAMIFKDQLSVGNETKNKGSKNVASLGGSALSGAIGNIGVNVAAGNNNAQSNMTAIAVGPATVGIAKVGIHQESAGNKTENLPVEVEGVRFEKIDVEFSAVLKDVEYTGTYDGGGRHRGSVYDLNDNNGCPPAATACYSGTQDESGEEKGSISGSILGKITGTIPVKITKNVGTINTASLSGSALSGATGNIGVNIAAGTGNLQANALAVTYLPK